jgi:hypothetical protein
MEVASMSNFLVGSILCGLGLVALAIAVVTTNNIFAKYWKPVKIWMPRYFDQPAPRFMTQDEAASTKVPPYI